MKLSDVVQASNGGRLLFIARIRNVLLSCPVLGASPSQIMATQCLNTDVMEMYKSETLHVGFDCLKS